MKRKLYNNEEIKFPALLSPIVIDSPNDKFLPYRDHLTIFQTKNRGYVPKQKKIKLPDLRKRKYNTEELNLAAPFRLQSTIHREIDFRQTPRINEYGTKTGVMEKTGSLNNIRYQSKKYKRFLTSRNDFETLNGYSRCSNSPTQYADTNHSCIKSPKSVTPIHLSRDSSMGRLSPVSTSRTSNDYHPIHTPPVLHKSYGSSSNVRVKQTLAQFLIKYGFEKSALCTLSSDGFYSARDRTYSNKSLLSRIDSYIIDSSSYDEFARRNTDKAIATEKTFRFIPKTCDHSVSRSELGICFPVFISEGAPIKKCGHVLK